MVMTEELARRILERPLRQQNVLTPTKQTELLMDWLEGQDHTEYLGVKYHISKSQVGTIIKRARVDAAKRLKVKGE